MRINKHARNLDQYLIQVHLHFRNRPSAGLLSGNTRHLFRKVESRPSTFWLGALLLTDVTIVTIVLTAILVGMTWARASRLVACNTLRVAIFTSMPRSSCKKCVDSRISDVRRAVVTRWISEKAIILMT